MVDMPGVVGRCLGRAEVGGTVAAAPTLTSTPGQGQVEPQKPPDLHAALYSNPR